MSDKVWSTLCTSNFWVVHNCWDVRLPCNKPTSKMSEYEEKGISRNLKPLQVHRILQLQTGLLMEQFTGRKVLMNFPSFIVSQKKVVNNSSLGSGFSSNLFVFVEGIEEGRGIYHSFVRG